MTINAVAYASAVAQLSAKMVTANVFAFLVKPVIGSKNTTGMEGVSMDDFLRSNINDAWRAIIIEEDTGGDKTVLEQESEGLQGVDTSVLMAYVNLEMSLHRCRKALGIRSKRKHYVDDTPVVLVESSSELGMKIVHHMTDVQQISGKCNVSKS